MSEAMTSELIIEAEWLLKGYWTRTRFAFPAQPRGWSDVDVLAYHPESKHLVISESKARGGKDHVCAYTERTRRRYDTFVEYDARTHKYLSFLRHLPTLCTNGIVFQNFPQMVNRLTVQLVCNYAIAPNLRQDVDTELDGEARKLNLVVTPELQLLSHIEVMSRIVDAEYEHNQGRRHGNPILDLAREINRYRWELRPQQ